MGKMNIRKLPEGEKPREKLLKEGKEKLSNIEILAILIGSGSGGRSAMELAADIISMDSSGIRYLAECKPEELSCIKGIGNAKACEILAAVELGKRLASMIPDEKPVIKSSSAIADIFMERMRYYKKEYFISLMINAKGQIIEEAEISIGDLCSSTTHPREVFVDAVRRSAGSVIFVHNHPSGDPMPSEMDIATTKRLMEAGSILGIPVLDHIIIGDGKYVSLRAMGIMEE
ncbi:MAG: DNA repair protein RadC [Firmicutes bacterium]|nr:DNA repair protein RadC [Bacillota bacterium]MBQ4596738.1 DNA repair protein RadC [Bacillota bacterium]